MIKSLEDFFYPKMIYKKHPNTQDILNYAINVLGSKENVARVLNTDLETLNTWIIENINLDKKKINLLIKKIYPRRSSERHSLKVIDNIFIDSDKLESEFELMLNKAIEYGNFNYKSFGIESDNKENDKWGNYFSEEKKNFYDKNSNYKNLWKVKNYKFLSSFEKRLLLIEGSYDDLVDSLKGLRFGITQSYQKNKDVEELQFSDLNLQLLKLKNIVSNFNIKVENKLEDFEQKLWKDQYDTILKEIENYLKKIDKIKADKIIDLNKKISLEISDLEKSFKNEFYPNFDKIKELNNKGIYLKEDFLEELFKLIPKKLKLELNGDYYINDLAKKVSLLDIRTKDIGFVGVKLHEVNIFSRKYEFFILNNNTEVLLVEHVIKEITKETYRERKGEFKVEDDAIKVLAEKIRLGTYDRGVSIESINIAIIYQLKKLEKQLCLLTKQSVIDKENLSDISKLWLPMTPKDLIKEFRNKIDKDIDSFKEKNEVLYEDDEEVILLVLKKLENLKKVFFNAGFDVDGIEMLFE